MNMQPRPLSTAELRHLILKRCHTLQRALQEVDLVAVQRFSLEDLGKLCNGSGFHATGIPSRESTEFGDQGQELIDAGVRQLFSDLQAGCRGEFATEVAAVDATSTAADCDPLRSRVDDGPSGLSEAGQPTVPRNRLLLAFGSVAPREGFSAWSSRMLLTGVDMFHGLAQLLGPNTSARNGTGLVTKEEFCEAVVLLNGNVDEAAEWFEMMRDADDSTSQSALGGNHTLRCCVLQRRVLSHPHLEVADAANAPLTSEEIGIRLAATWGDLSAAFGFTSSDAARFVTAGQGKGWHATKRDWLRALRGKLGRHLLEEREARAEADRCVALRTPIMQMFPNLCDRLLVPKTKWMPDELITIRYTLTESGFWGPAGPSPMERGSGTGRRLVVGARPFIAAISIPDASAENKEACRNAGRNSPRSSKSPKSSMLPMSPSLPMSPRSILSDVPVVNRAVVDAHAAYGTTFLRAPMKSAKDNEPASIRSTKWKLCLFSSDDGVTPLAALSTPLLIQVDISEPAPPSSVFSCGRTHNSITFTWTLTRNDGGARVQLYELCVWEWGDGSPNLDFGRSVWRGQTSELLHEVTSLRPDCDYFARVRCINCVGTGLWSARSEPISTGPKLPETMLPPRVIEVGSTDALLQWVPKENVDALQYSVQAMPMLNDSTPSGVHDMQVFTFAGDATTASCTGLLANMRYRFEVRVHNVSGCGPWSHPSAGIRTKPGVPQAPSCPAIEEVGRSSMRVTWEAPHNNGGSSVASYIVRAEASSGDAECVEASFVGPPAWLDGLQGNTPYTLKVAAVNAMGTSTFSLPSQPTRTGPVAPQPPSRLCLLDSCAQSATLCWSPPEDNGGSPITQYTVSVTPAALAPCSAVSFSVPRGEAESTFVVLPPLVGAVQYRVAVHAVSAAGVSKECAALTLTTGSSVPVAPSDPPYVASRATQTTVPLRWDPPVHDGGCRVLQFEVLIALADQTSRDSSASLPSAAGDGWQDALRSWRRVASEDCAVTVTGLEPHRSYHFAVRAQSSEGWGKSSKWSAPIKTAPTVPGATSAPRPLRPTLRSIDLEWDRPESDAPVLGYEVWGAPAAQKDGVRGDRRRRVTRRAVRMDDLAPATEYTFRVRARNCSGWSQWSASSTICSTLDTCSDDIRTFIRWCHGGTTESAFRAFDRDGDGVISREEFLISCAVLPVERRLQLFDQADERGCGRLTYCEFAKHFEQRKSAQSESHMTSDSIQDYSIDCGRNFCPRIGSSENRRARSSDSSHSEALLRSLHSPPARLAGKVDDALIESARTSGSHHQSRVLLGRGMSQCCSVKALSPRKQIRWE